MSDESPVAVAALAQEASPATSGGKRGAEADDFAELRRSCPVSTPRPGVHLVVRHADVAAILTDVEHFSGASPRTLAGRKPEADLSLQELGGPRHHSIRGLWLTALRRSAIAPTEPTVRELCRERVGDLAAAGRAEVVADLARPVVREALDYMIGIPLASRKRVHAWIQDQKEDEAGSFAALRGQASAASRAALDHWIAGEAMRRRALSKPPDDIFARLMAATGDGGVGLTQAEFAAQVRFLCRAGTGSTVQLIANVVYELARVPARYARLREDRSLISVAIDESLRHAPPGAFTARTCITETELGGVRIKPGDEVILSLASANRDESVFPNPERFDLQRGRLPVQVSFGRGSHRCPGALIARMIATNLIEAMLNQMVEVRLAPGFVFESEDFCTRGPSHLSIELFAR